MCPLIQNEVKKKANVTSLWISDTAVNYKPEGVRVSTVEHGNSKHGQHDMIMKLCRSRLVSNKV